MNGWQTFWDLVAAAARASGLSDVTDRGLLLALAVVLTAALAAVISIGLALDHWRNRKNRSWRTRNDVRVKIRRKASVYGLVWALAVASVAILASVETREKPFGPNAISSAETNRTANIGYVDDINVAEKKDASTGLATGEEFVADAEATSEKVENRAAESSEASDSQSDVAASEPASTSEPASESVSANEPPADAAKPFESLKTQSVALEEARKFAQKLDDVPARATLQTVGAPKGSASTLTPGTFQTPASDATFENAGNAGNWSTSNVSAPSANAIPPARYGASPTNPNPNLNAPAAPAVQASQAVQTFRTGPAPNATRPDALATRGVQPAYNENVQAVAPVPASRSDAKRGVLFANFAPTRPILPYPVLQASATVGANGGTSVRSAGFETANYSADEDSLLARLDDEYSRVSELVGASVLAVETLKFAGGASQKKVEETGCGFLAQYGGRVFLLTNRHVVVDALGDEAIKIFLPGGRVVHPTKTTSCADFDLAVLELNADDLPKDGSVSLCYFGDSDSLRVASMVGAVGNPFGLDNSITYGRVSSVGRRNLPLNKADKKSINEYIQIDCAINPGNSGGPLFNARGEVVGIVTAIATTTGKNEGVAFAVPINTALLVVQAMIEKGEWRRSQMGVELLPAKASDFGAANDASSRPLGGAKIAKVWNGSPAERAGLREGDVVVSFEGEAIDDDWRLARTIALTSADERPVLGVLRGGRLVEVQTSLASAKNENER